MNYREVEMQMMRSNISHPRVLKAALRSRFSESKLRTSVRVKALVRFVDLARAFCSIMFDSLRRRTAGTPTAMTASCKTTNMIAYPDVAAQELSAIQTTEP
jgi:hypothetical protein